MNFKSEFTFEQRYEEAHRVLKKYPDRIPIVCEKNRHASISCPDIDKKKYLVPIDLKIAAFIFVIRKRLKLPAEKAIFLFVGNKIATSNSSISELYNFNKDDDGFLYISYSLENVFG